MVWDVERGAPNKILVESWQSCSCLGGWHYSTSVYDNNQYKSASDVVKLLVDIVSKNGNLLLSVPLRADGTFDEKEEKISIFNLLNDAFKIDGRTQTFINAVKIYCKSVFDAIEECDTSLIRFAGK